MLWANPQSIATRPMEASRGSPWSLELVSQAWPFRDLVRFLNSDHGALRRCVTRDIDALVSQGQIRTTRSKSIGQVTPSYFHFGHQFVSVLNGSTDDELKPSLCPFKSRR